MKKIVKTKIIGTKEQETSNSQKKRKFLSALAAGLGGWQLASEQDKWGKRNQKTEEIYTFLVIYDDNSRETVDAIKGSDKYNELLMYIE